MSRATKGKTLAEVFAAEEEAKLAPKVNGHTTAHSFDMEPISRVEWVEKSTLRANHYNPNSVAPPERELIIRSILEDGWTQPIVVLSDGEIVDGFHRWFLSDDPRLMKRYHGWVPITRIVVDPVHQKMSTIRHNRARGTHGIKPMSQIVTEMLRDGITAAKIQAGLGMDEEEITRLATNLGMPELACSANFSKAWKPGERPEE